MPKCSKAEQKLAMREQAKREIRGSKYEASGHRAYRQDVDAGLKQLRTVSAEGGDASAKRAKNELNYLLNNYLPSYDARIEQLIDIWRRSGDPEYDPAIRARFRRVSGEHHRRSNPL